MGTPPSSLTRSANTCFPWRNREVVEPRCEPPLGEVKEQDLGGFGALPCQGAFLTHADGISAGERDAIEGARPLRNVKPGVASCGDRVGGLLTRFETAYPQIGVLVDGEGAVPAGFAGDELQGARFHLGQGAVCVPGGGPVLIGGDPDL